MAPKIQILCAIIFFSLISEGSCQYTLSDVKISQEETGAQVGNKPERLVTISSNIPCTIEDLKLDCKGFKTTENPDPKYFSVSGDECVITYQGQPVIPPTSSLNFKYAWDAAFPFKTSSGTISCS